jgi:hypothetical protein
MHCLLQLHVPMEVVFEILWFRLLDGRSREYPTKDMIVFSMSLKLPAEAFQARYLL